MAQWANYTALFHVDPQSSANSQASVYPTFEGVGNHDGGNSTDPESGLVRRAVMSRNKNRANLTNSVVSNYSLSDNSLHYSWDWSGVHFIMLGVYPGTEGDCASGTGIKGNGCDSGSAAPWGWHSPEQSH